MFCDNGQITRKMPIDKSNDGPTQETNPKDSRAMQISEDPMSGMSIKTFIVLYSATVTPLLRRDSPKTKKYRPMLTWISSKIARTAFRRGFHPLSFLFLAVKITGRTEV